MAASEGDCASSTLVFYVNGAKVSVTDPDPRMMLLQYLRSELRLTGSKPSCGEGGCGACTVMVSNYDRAANIIVHRAVVSCITPLCALHGCAITTIEGVGSCRAGLHPIQARLVEKHGIQCGFCTPGMVMSMYALLRSDPCPTMEDIERAIEGNLCRCTGYRPILEGLNTFSKEYQCSLGEECCRSTKSPSATDGESCADSTRFSSYDPTQEPIFPAQLQVSDTYDRTSLRFVGPEITWFRPVTLSDLMAILTLHPTAEIVSGYTSIGPDVKENPGVPRVLVTLSHITELQTTEENGSGLLIGGGVSLTRLEGILKQAITRLPVTKAKHFVALNNMILRYGSQQIRNMATLGGSVMSAMSNSDVIVLLVASGAVATIVTSDGSRRTIALDSKFFPEENRTILKRSEVLLNITIPFSHQEEVIFGYKQAWRRNFDLAVVNSGLRVGFDAISGVVTSATLCFGGVAPRVIVAESAANAMIGRKLDDRMADDVNKVLIAELGKTTEYRRTLASSFFFKFYLTLRMELASRGIGDVLSVDPEVISATQRCHRNPVEGTQVYEEVPADQPKDDPVGRPIHHVTTKQMSTGEARYTTDLRKQEGELYLAHVKSTKAHARLVEVDPSAALRMPGVVGYVDHRDVPGSNKVGIMINDDEVFATEKVTCHSQVIGAIVAETEDEARRAATAVRVVYDELPVITTIEEAISKGSFYDFPTTKMEYGDVVRGLEKADHVLEGEARFGYQEHYYLETQGCLVVPSGEADEIDVFLGTQHYTHVQDQLSLALGIPSHKIVVRTKRSGGAFGGKESRGTITVVLIPSAVAAMKFQRPVRCILSRQEDFATSGQRHPYMAKYKVGFSKAGKLLALDCNLYHNGGSVTDSSCYIGWAAQVGVDCSYRFEHLTVKTHSCRTNTPSPTAMRGYGKPQAIFITENIVDNVAQKLGISPQTVRELNLYKSTDHHLTLPLQDGLQRCWEQVRRDSDYDTRRLKVDDFNKANRWKKRGLCMVPSMFGLGFPVTSMNQSGAFVNVYKDGTVLLAHGGAEVGQGLNTKMIQIASRVLGVPIDNIHTMESATNLVPNTSVAAGSNTSDLNGPAVIDACQKIRTRIEPYRAAKPSESWANWVLAAYLDRVCLSATGFYRTDPNIMHGDAWLKGTGPLYLYYTYGAACVEVEVDCLTGDHVIPRTDIVMDVGRSLNSAIDIGQIEGAFMQGVGMYTIEELQIQEDGVMRTLGPETYKIPTVGNIPVKFNVALLKGSSNPRAVYSSKGIGEPPLLLGSGVFFAIKDAIRAARADHGLKGSFRFDCPATAERIRMACVDQFTQQATGSTDFVPEWRA